MVFHETAIQDVNGFRADGPVPYQAPGFWGDTTLPYSYISNNGNLTYSGRIPSHKAKQELVPEMHLKGYDAQICDETEPLDDISGSILSSTVI